MANLKLRAMTVEDKGPHATRRHAVSSGPASEFSGHCRGLPGSADFPDSTSTRGHANAPTVTSQTTPTVYLESEGSDARN
jgi:hypothetical protein